jgi:hypothetical protein
MTRWRQPSVSPCIIASRNSPQRPIIAKTEQAVYGPDASREVHPEMVGAIPSPFRQPLMS